MDSDATNSDAANSAFPFWQAPYLSFFSNPFYRDVAGRWRGLALGYLLLLLAITWLPNIFVLNNRLVDFRATYLPYILEQVPSLEIQGGEVRTDVKMPYTISLPDNEGTLAVIDTSASVDDLKNLDTFILITKDQLISKQSSNQTRMFSLTDLEGLSVDKDMLGRWADTSISWTRILAYPLLVLNSWGYRFFQALLFGVLGLIIASALKVTLPYAALVRLSVIALTPVIVIRTLLEFFSITLPFWWLIAFAVSVVYLYQAIRANQGITTDEGIESGV
jgi:Protein of unknown function (DUF1189)